MRGDQRGLRMCPESLFGDEEEGQDTHCQMVMQSPPSAHLVLGQADLGFGILESPFDPKPTGLTFGQSVEGGLSGGIAQSIGARAIDVFAN